MFTFPDPVNEYAARTVAAGVVVLAVMAIAFDQHWLVVLVAYGFWARLLTGPKLSPLGQLATRVVAPRLPFGPRLVPGPPKRFAQGIGCVFSSAALVLWYGLGLSAASWTLIGLLAAAAASEAFLGVCLGCIAFAGLMRAGVIPERVCESCADLSLHHGRLTTGRPG